MAHYGPGKRSPHRVMRRSLTRVAPLFVWVARMWVRPYKPQS